MWSPHLVPLSSDDATNSGRGRGLQAGRRYSNKPSLPPSRPNPLKVETYECGVETVGDTWVQFKVQYYLVALVFLVFDIEMVLLFPWAVAYNSLGWFAFLAGGIFILLLLEGLIYAWRRIDRQSRSSP